MLMNGLSYFYSTNGIVFSVVERIILDGT
jgi:hypothetical protein